MTTGRGIISQAATALGIQAIAPRDKFDVALDHRGDTPCVKPELDLAETRRREPRIKPPSLWDEAAAAKCAGSVVVTRGIRRKAA